MKPSLKHVTDPATIAAIERNGWGDPVPAMETDTGYWVEADQLEQYRQQFTDTEGSR